MQLTQEQRELVCKAYEIATDIAEYGKKLGYDCVFSIDRDLWVRINLGTTQEPVLVSRILTDIMNVDCLATMETFRITFLTDLERRIIARAQERLDKLTEDKEDENNA